LAGSGGGGVGAFGVGKAGPETFGLAEEEEELAGSGKGTSGWPCIIRRSEARSLYFGPLAVVVFVTVVEPGAAVRAFAAFSFAVCRSASFAKFFC
jgi:hypothetical protein